MGSNFAHELADGTLGTITLEDQLAIHLRSNHYPPVPLSMVQPCIEAIDAYWEDDLAREIDLPEGISWKGNTTAPARNLIEAHHLDAWITEAEEIICTFCLDNEKSCNACDDSYEEDN
jgi:hypothetical protein